MIAAGMRVIDIDPSGYTNFRSALERIRTDAPLALLWHEDGEPRRLTVDGELRPGATMAVRDARDTARRLHGALGGRARRVVVADMDGYLRVCRAMNLPPEEGEEKYAYLHRRNLELRAEFDESLAIYPEPGTDRGPVPFAGVSSFFAEHTRSEPAAVALGVFDRGEAYFGLVVRLERGAAVQAAGFEHWPALRRGVSFDAGGLDTVIREVEAAEGRVACGLFLDRPDFERLFDGRRHDALPGSLIVSGRAFGITNLPGVADRAFLYTAGLFAYVPVAPD